jgi:predicted PurR-regulated permease PerM
MTPLRSKFELNLGLLVTAALLLACLLVLWPFMTAMLWGAILSFSSWPLYCRVLKLVRGRRSLASLIITGSMVLTLLLPFVLAGSTVGEGVKELKDATQQWLDKGPPPPPAWLQKVPGIGRAAAEQWQTLAADTTKVKETAKQLVEPVGTWLLQLGLKLTIGLLQLTLSILITFFFLRNGPFLVERLSSGIARIAGERGEHFLVIAGNTVRGVVYGILGTALVQAAMAGVGFFMAGVPGAGLLALLTFFLAIIPVGPPLVWLPAALWLFSQGSTGWGVFMLIWGMGVSCIDNVVKPWLISQGSDMPFVLILFGVLGGAFAFGFIGVFIGPTLLAVGYRIVDEWLTVGRVDKANTPQPVPESSTTA